MGARARGACLVALAIVAIGCQKVWGFEDFEEGPGVGGAAGAGGAGTGGGAGAAPCEHPSAPAGMAGVRTQDGSCVWVDPKEITRGQYDAFRTTSPAKPQGCSWNSSLDAPESTQPASPCLGPGEVADGGADAGSLDPNLPVTCVDWCDAYMFCLARGATLCPGQYGKATQGAWYDACSSGGGNDWPYGKTYEPKRCNDNSAGAAVLEPVGNKTTCTTPNGIFDLAGNASEWTAACVGESASDECDTRGGGPNDDQLGASCEGKVGLARGLGLPTVGFRCCWLPPT